MDASEDALLQEDWKLACKLSAEALQALQPFLHVSSREQDSGPPRPSLQEASNARRGEKKAQREAAMDLGDRAAAVVLQSLYETHQFSGALSRLLSTVRKQKMKKGCGGRQRQEDLMEMENGMGKLRSHDSRNHRLLFRKAYFSLDKGRCIRVGFASVGFVIYQHLLLLRTETPCDNGMRKIVSFDFSRHGRCTDDSYHKLSCSLETWMKCPQRAFCCGFLSLWRIQRRDPRPKRRCCIC